MLNLHPTEAGPSELEIYERSLVIFEAEFNSQLDVLK